MQAMEIEGQKLLKEARKADLKLAKSSTAGKENLAESKQDLRSRITKTISKLIEENDTENLIAALDFFEISSPQCPVIGKDAEHAEDLIRSAKKIAAKFRFEKAEGLFNAAVSPEEEARFEKRNKWLEEAMRIIASQIHNKESDPFGANLLLGKCYYERGRNILPQGEDVPPRKLEAMRKALHYLKEAEDIIRSSKGANGADFTFQSGLINFKRAEVLHELYRLDRERYLEDLKKALAQVVKVKKFNPKTVQDYFILDHYCDLYDCGGTNKWDKNLFNNTSSTATLLLHRENLELLRARAAFRLYKSDKLCKEELVKAAKSAVEAMEGFALFYPCWDDILEFISYLKELNGKKTVDEWRDLAIHAWEICEEKERQFNFGLQLRQYWSRLKGLYELALDAARKNEDWLVAAKVVDSLKGRTPRIWKQVVGSLSQHSKKTADALNKTKTFFDNEAQATTGYVPLHKDFAGSIKYLSRRRAIDFINIDRIPAGWSAIHLYFGKDKEVGFRDGWALIGRKLTGSKDVIWKDVHLKKEELSEIWDAYKKWLNNYRELPNEYKYRSCKPLDELCTILGKNLKFIFEEIRKNKNIVWIPYDFAHKLPLHAAKDPKTGKYLFQECASTYIPAWSLASRRAVVYPRISAYYTEGNYCLRFFNKKGDESLKVLYDNGPWTGKRDSASRDQLLEFAKIFREKPPRNLAIFCHGVAHEANPFDSKLMLGEEGVTLLDLHCMNLNLTGTRVFLGACETEMTPDKPTRLDEHLSLAGAFLTMGCAEVMGALWQCEEPMVHELIEDALEEKTPLWKITHSKRQEWLGSTPKHITDDIYKKNRLYYIAPFRAIGYPVSS